jgi:hypothetical protein
MGIYYSRCRTSLWRLGGLAVLAAIFRKGIWPGFLSYHHSRYDQVLRLRECLAKSGFNPRAVPYLPVSQHDELLDNIYTQIEQSDFFICFPDPDRSFVEAEVSAAIAKQKSIFIVLSAKNCRSPNTSQKSYPTLSLDKLLSEKFASLIEFLRYAYGDWISTVKMLLNGPPGGGWFNEQLIADDCSDYTSISFLLYYLCYCYDKFFNIKST